MDDTSTFVANARLGQSLRLDHDAVTDVSGMTDVSWETPSVVSGVSSSDQERVTSSSLPPSRFRGSTMSRFGHFGSGRSVGGGSVSGRSVGSRMSRMDRSTRSGISQLHEIAEEEAEASEVDEAESIYIDNTSDGISVRSGNRTGMGSGFLGGFGLGSGYSGSSVGGSSRVGSDRMGSQVPSSGASYYSGAGGEGDGGFNTEGMFSAGMFSIQESDDASVSSGLTMGMQSVASGMHHHQPQPASQYGSQYGSAGSVSGSHSVTADLPETDDVGSARHRPPAPYTAASGEGSRRLSDEEMITKDERANIILSAFDNTRLPTHNPKVEATREVDVSHYQESIVEADEITALPEEYVCDMLGRRYHPKEVPQEERVNDPSLNRPDYEDLTLGRGEGDEPWRSPFSDKRKAHSMVTVLAAVSLAVAGLCLSIRSLSPPDDTRQYKAEGSAFNDNDGGHLYLPGYQFGGGLGGLVGGRERERRIQLVYGQYGANVGAEAPYAPARGHDAYAPANSENPPDNESNIGGRYTGGRNNVPGRGGTQGMASYQTAGGASYHESVQHFFAPAQEHKDPYGGMGPPQFDPRYGSDHLPALTSTPLTAYAPPPHDGSTVVLEPNFNGAFMDLSSLPYNPQSEIPVVWDVQLSGNSVIKSVFGNCLRLVQCTERGKEILRRERELEEGTGREADEGRRMLRSMKKEIAAGRDTERELVAAEHMGQEFVREAEPLEQEVVEEDVAPAAPFDPPLRTEVVYTSTYVNVDCTSPSGVDRGIRHDLATSNMVDAVYSPDVHDVGRMFAPPTEAYGRMVAMLRDPLERGAAKYAWMRYIDDEVKQMSLEEFAASSHLEDNILTRTLTNKRDPNIALSDRDLVVAKEILGRKFVVGLFDWMEDSLLRFETFFGWSTGDAARTCQHGEVGRTMEKHYNRVEAPTDDVKAVEALRAKNGYDEKLYEYAQFLYDYQGHALFGVNKSVE